MQSTAFGARDRGFFEGWNRPERFPDLSMAARLMGKPFGGLLNAYVGKLQL
jgi:hypothetical protein